MNEGLTTPPNLPTASGLSTVDKPSRHFDWMVIALSSWFVGGLLLLESPGRSTCGRA